MPEPGKNFSLWCKILPVEYDVSYLLGLWSHVDLPSALNGSIIYLYLSVNVRCNAQCTLYLIARSHGWLNSTRVNHFRESSMFQIKVHKPSNYMVWHSMLWSVFETSSWFSFQVAEVQCDWPTNRKLQNCLMNTFQIKDYSNWTVHVPSNFWATNHEISGSYAMTVVAWALIEYEQSETNYPTIQTLSICFI